MAVEKPSAPIRRFAAELQRLEPPEVVDRRSEIEEEVDDL